jgi:pantoate--beta-alanine ligase
MTRKWHALKKLETVVEVRGALDSVRRSGRRIGLVPTMGAIHEGHRSLMRRARADCEIVIVSIFVNPTQFGPGEDYLSYPRPLEKDLEACREEGVDYAFCPPVEEMYDASGATTVHIAGLTEGLCGAFRPGHFEGVTTVVAKLFNIVQPDAAYFGQKDAQQAIVIRRMIRDLYWPIELVICPTVREPDGLALSSRNAYLTADQRRQAVSLLQALREAEVAIHEGQRDVPTLTAMMRRRIEQAGPCVIDYVEIVDADDLSPKSRAEGNCLLALAVRIGRSRLIDNLLVDAPGGR